MKACTFAQKKVSRCMKLAAEKERQIGILLDRKLRLERELKAVSRRIEKSHAALDKLNGDLKRVFDVFKQVNGSRVLELAV